MKTTVILPDDLVNEVKILAVRERRKPGEMMAELVQAGIESRSKQQADGVPARRKAAQRGSVAGNGSRTS